MSIAGLWRRRKVAPLRRAAAVETLCRLERDERIAYCLRHSGYRYDEIGRLLGYAGADVVSLMARTHEHIKRVLDETVPARRVAR